MHNPFVYKWTELSTGKWYIGSRTAIGCHPDDGYICSSKVVKPMIQSNPDGWVRQIIKMGSKVDMLAEEMRILSELDAANDPMSYNKMNVFSKRFLNKDPWNKGIKTGKISRPQWITGLTKENNESLAASSKKKLGKPNLSKGKKRKPNSEKQKMEHSARMKDILFTEEHKEKISKALTGKVRSPEHCKKISESKIAFYAKKRAEENSNKSTKPES